MHGENRHCCLLTCLKPLKTRCPTGPGKGNSAVMRAPYRKHILPLPFALCAQMAHLGGCSWLTLKSARKIQVAYERHGGCHSSIGQKLSSNAVGLISGPYCKAAYLPCPSYKPSVTLSYFFGPPVPILPAIPAFSLAASLSRKAETERATISHRWT